jgi:hypothetical protein
MVPQLEPVMAYNEEQLRRLNADYTAVTGKPVQRLVCPITLMDEPGTALCDGHILNASIKTAARKTVVQRLDVDNHFGTTLEPELVSFLNTPVSTFQQLISKSKSLTVTLPSGEKAEAFLAGPKARAKFPQIDLLDKSGTTIASPFLRTRPLEPKLHKGLQIEWLMLFTDSALLGAMLKTAYLALFRLLGYRAVLSRSADCLRQALASFYNDKAGKEQSLAYFSKFTGAVNVFLSEGAQPIRNTLDDNSLLFHYQPGGVDKNRLFAISCLFRVNGRTIIVMVPQCLDGESFEAAYPYYKAVLNDKSVPQDIHHACFTDGKLTIETGPLPIKFAPPPAPK